MAALRRLRATVALEPPLTVEATPDEAYRAELAEVVIEPLEAGSDARHHGRSRFEAVVDGWRFEVTVEDAELASLRERASRAASVVAAGSVIVRARIPGRITALYVAPGDEVAAGQRLVAIEAMKMENEVRAPRAGTIARVSVVVGRPIEQGSELVEIG
ncbi:MAG TPA: biotin/lipoyl-containing protein [Candidatus Limnocylindrales bacterium]|jgi:biotin carboxyl carrier protein|nr:biotin/lipoyl-containing protein [Candidatus Limnocylindrales bacterium]